MLKWSILVIVLVVVIGGFYFLNKHNTPVNERGITLQPTPTSQPTPNITPSPSPSAKPTEKVITSKEATSIPSGTRGQITCNYQIPAAPNQFGTAKIESNWNSAKIEVCVSANGGNSSLMSSDNNLNGSREDMAPWISLDTEYIFTLYNQSGNQSDCNGAVLSSCQLSTK